MNPALAIAVIMVGTPIAALICWDIAQTARRILDRPPSHDDYSHIDTEAGDQR